MLITNLNTQLKVTVANIDFYFDKSKLYQQLLNSELLAYVSLKDLLPLFVMGIPDNIKEFLKQKIQLYKDSFKIHSFIYNKHEYWLDSKTRSSLHNLSKTTLDNIDFILQDQIIKVSPSKLQKFIDDLEAYAYKCHVNTFKHLQTVDTLTNIEDIFNYDYTTGYPEKVILDI